MTHHVSMTAINEQQYDTIQFHCRFYVLRLFHLEEKFARISIDRSIAASELQNTRRDCIKLESTRATDVLSSGQKFSIAVFENKQSEPTFPSSPRFTSWTEDAWRKRVTFASRPCANIPSSSFHWPL